MVKVPFRLPKSCRGLTSASHIETEPPPFGFDDSPLFLCNRRDLFRLIEARDVYRIGADLLELAATDVEESRAEEAATAIAALAANRRAPTGGSSEQQSKPSPPHQVLVPSWPAQHGAFVEQSGRKRRRSGASAAAAETA